MTNGNECEIIVRLAGLPVALRCGGERAGRFMRDFFRDYLTDEEPLFAVQADREAVRAEAASAAEPRLPEYNEALCLYRAVAERLPFYGAAVFHGAAVEYDGRAYLFTAPSGTGKSTHIALWRRFLGEKVGIINGDKPILRMTPDGIAVFGTPFAGREGWQRNVSAPLAGVCVLSQGTENRAEPAEGSALSLRLLAQTYRPQDREALQKTMTLVGALCGFPCYTLACDVSEAAVIASFEAVTGRKYEVEKYADQ